MALLQSIVTARRDKRKNNIASKAKDMMDHFLDIEDENGDKLGDDYIIDILLMYLNAGHESSGHTMMWAAILMQENPEVFKKAKVCKKHT